MKWLEPVVGGINAISKLMKQVLRAFVVFNPLIASVSVSRRVAAHPFSDVLAAS